MVTLHGYILRELLKTFGLTVLALTALFTMGGGLYNVLKVEGVTTGDLFTVLPILIPVSITVTMPIAALFATTITYGRLAADNEMVACRAAGINVHRLFLSAILLSVFVALATAIAWNILFPSCLQQIMRLAKSNIRNLAYHRLVQRGYVDYGKAGKQQLVLTAEGVLGVAAEQLIEKGFDPPSDTISYFWVEQPTLLIVDKSGNLERFAVADGGLCQFNTQGLDLELTLYAKNARDYEAGGKDVVQARDQRFGPITWGIPFSPKPAMVDLETLREWRAAPWREAKLGSEVDRFLDLLRCHVFHTECGRRLAAGQTLVLFDEDDTRYEIQAATCGVTETDVIAGDATISRYAAARGDARADELPIRYEAPQVTLRARPTRRPGVVELEMRLDQTQDQVVREYVPHAGGYGTPLEKDAVQLSGLRVPEFVSDRMRVCAAAAVLDPTAELPTNERLEAKRGELQAGGAKLLRKINGVIHFRFGLAASALVTILMGGMLGLIFRGARALAAFGLACIPLGIVLILIAMGKQITESEHTQAIGPFVIWGGLALVAVADGLILRIGVRR